MLAASVPRCESGVFGYSVQEVKHLGLTQHCKAAILQ